MARRKRRPPEGIFIRLYPDREEDQVIIEWLDQNAPAVYGARSQTIKSALLRGIQGENAGTESGSSVAIDWSMLRQVVSSALESVLVRMQVAPSPQQLPVEANVPVDVDIAGLVGIWGDNDDDE